MSRRTRLDVFPCLFGRRARKAVSRRSMITLSASPSRRPFAMIAPEGLNSATAAALATISPEPSLSIRR